MKFIKNIGNASTSASINGKSLGQNVNAALYERDGKPIVQLESNGTVVKKLGSTALVSFDSFDAYDEWEDDRGGKDLMLHGLHLFGCTTSFD